MLHNCNKSANLPLKSIFLCCVIILFRLEQNILNMRWVVIHFFSITTKIYYILVKWYTYPLYIFSNKCKVKALNHSSYSWWKQHFWPHIFFQITEMKNCLVWLYMSAWSWLTDGMQAGTWNMEGGSFLVDLFNQKMPTMV